MCRIVGIKDTNSLSYDIEKTLKHMRDTLEHGGPDDAGSFILKEKGIALGHRRLSIIDTSKSGHQPFSDPTKRFWITYNGEIYNFKSIKDELKNDNISFKSHSDTEVLLHSYIKWGIDCIHKFRGMFAFSKNLKRYC